MFLLAQTVVSTVPVFTLFGLQVSRTIDISTLIAVGSVVIVLLKIWRSQALRDQKIDFVLFGVDGKTGLVGDVKDIQDHLSRRGFHPRVVNHERRRR